MKLKTLFILTPILALSLACSIFVGGPDYLNETIPASTAEVEGVQTQIANALLDGATSGFVTVKFSESQVTSLVAAKLDAMDSPPFTDPQVTLRDGQMKIYGKINRGYFTANVLITVNVGVDPETGTPTIEIASADFGPFPAPEGLNSAVSAMVAEEFTGYLGPVAVGFRLEAISIANGIMTITGRIK